MSTRKQGSSQNIHWSVIVALLLVGLISVYLLSNANTGLIIHSAVSKPVTLTGAWGNPGFPSGQPKCIYWEDYDGTIGINCLYSETPYACGMVFRAIGRGAVEDVTCNIPAACEEAVADAITKLEAGCSAQPACKILSVTGGTANGSCVKGTGNDFISTCKADVFGKCGLDEE